MMRALSVALGFSAAALARLQSLPLAQDVVWFTSPNRVAWSAVEPPVVCALDAFHFGVQFVAPKSVQYKEQDTFRWQLVAKKVEGWENGAIVASGPLKGTFLGSQDPKEEEIRQELGQDGIKCEFDPHFCIPKLVNIRLPDINTEKEDGPSLKKDHSMELEFEQPTNRPDASSKQQIDQFVVFTEYIGDKLVGAWTDDGQVLVIRIVQIDEEKVKPVGELMQGLLRTGIFLKEGNSPVDEMGVFEGVQSLRIEPPGTYMIRVLVAEEGEFHTIN
ncbi:Extracellular protein SEL-1 [Phytophthora cinnamomi]|uniref:Extracellular protein SEL-1 n=1 Tax=Phytophthora cinnamomi TaxID=4785 RepID=UPI003559BD36|nr:Extracellular protein SEL-1 [Phytophthora cinnamomi]